MRKYNYANWPDQRWYSWKPAPQSKPPQEIIESRVSRLEIALALYAVLNLALVILMKGS